MKRETYLSWDTYFLSVAILSSFRSKDPKTQNGACIVDARLRIIGIGYNGLPRGCKDDADGYWEDNDDDPATSKHTYVVHAEKNAIYNCMAHDMTGATIYTTQFPCNTCAQAIIQVGIKEVVFANTKSGMRHLKMNQAVQRMFDDASVRSRLFSPPSEIELAFISGLKHLGELDHGR